MAAPDGRRITWASNGSGGFVRPYEYSADLSVVNGVYRVSFDDGSYWDFDAQGRLALMTAANGQTVAVNRGGAGQLSTVVSSTGAQLSFAYGTSGNANGKITSVTSPAGMVGYGYDSAGDLTTVTDVGGAVTTYAYDASHRMMSITDPSGVVEISNTFDSSGRVATQSHASGGVTTFTYGHDNASGLWTTVVSDSVTGSTGQVTYYWNSNNSNKEVQKVEDNLPNPSGGVGNAMLQDFADSLGDLTSATSRLGGQDSMVYDGSNHLLCDAQPGGSCPPTGSGLDGGTGPYTAYSYDSAGRLTARFVNGSGETDYTYTGDNRQPSTVTDPDGGVTRNTINDGRVTATVDPDGVETDYTYDTGGRVLAETVDGDTTTYTYDAAGRQTCQASPGGSCPDADGDGGSGSYTLTTYYPSGLVHTRRDADGGIATYTYDAAGRTLTVTDPAGAVTVNHYDPTTGLLTSVDKPGQVVGGVQQYATTRYTHDANGNQTCVAAPGGTCPNASGAGGVEPYTLTAYGPLARVTSTTNELGETTSYKYDADGDKVETDNPDGTVVKAAYDAAGHLYCTTTPGAPGQNNCPKLDGSGASGRYTITRYDSFGRVSCVAQPGGDCVAATGPITTYTYDNAGRQATVTDVNGGTSTTTYTPAGRKDTVTDPDGGVTTYTYDAAGRTSTVTNPDGGVTTTTYTPQGQVASTTDPAGLRTSYTYDAAGRQLTATGPDGVVTTRTYTARGELATRQTGGDGAVSYTYNGDGTVASVTDALGNTTTYTYDARGNRTSRTDAQGKSQSWVYDNADELVSQADQLNRATATTYHDDTAHGHKTVLSDPSGRVTTTVYNPDGTVGSTAYTGSAGSLTYTYGYDDLGHATSISDGSDTWGYTSNASGALTSETTPRGATTSWSYDPAGRRTTMTYPDGTQVAYTYYPSGLLEQMQVTPPGGQAQTAASYTYNADGQLTHVTLPDGSRSYTYGTAGPSAGKVVSYTQDLPGAATDATLAYDANGRLASQTVTTDNGPVACPSWGCDDPAPTRPLPPQLDVDVTAAVSDGSGSATTPAFDTARPNEMLVALVSAGGYSTPQTVEVSGGGLLWIPAARENAQRGDVEIWTATAVSPLSAATVTATQDQPVGKVAIEVLAFQGAAGVAVTAAAAGSTGPAAVSLTATSASSVVVGVGFDWKTAASTTVGDGQTRTFQVTQAGTNGNAWMQKVDDTTTSAGQTVSVDDVAPTGEAWNLAAAEVIPGAPVGVDDIVGNTSSSTSHAITASGLSTSRAGDLLVATVGFQSNDMGTQTASVSGAGLQWRLAARENGAGGDSEIWTADAPDTLSDVSVTATAANATNGGMLTVIALAGAADHVGATASGAGLGAPSLPLTTTAARSWVIAAGNDWSAATAHTPLDGQALGPQYQATGTGDDYWTQSSVGPITAARTTVDVGDSAPDDELWNLAAVEVLPAGASTPNGIGVDESRHADDATGSSTLAAPPIDTHHVGETLVALVSTGAAQAGLTQTATVTGGGLAWTLAARANSRDGDAEVWTATAPTPLDGLTVEVAAAQPTAGSALTVMSLTGAGGVGATATGGAASGAPTVSLTTTAAGSWVLGAGNDWDYATPRTPAAGQTILHERLAATGDDYWAQAAANPAGQAGSAVTLADTAPTDDQWNLAAAEVTPAGGQSGGTTVTTTYGYDAAGQLTSQTVNGVTTTYTYDTLGRRATATTGGQTTTYRYDDAGELCWTSTNPGAGSDDCAGPPAGADVFDHDQAGRLLTEQWPTGSVTYTYDPAGRAASIHVTDSGFSYDTTQTRAYNPTGDLTSADNAGTSTTSATMTWDDAVSTPTLISGTTDGDTADMARGAGQWQFALTDGVLAGIGLDVLGDVTPTDDTPGMAAAESYDAWGMHAEDAPSLEPALGYRGELQFSDLVDLRARTYDTTLGAFNTVDPLDGVNGTTTIAGLYPYADNNPIAYIDPTGNQSTDSSVFAMARGYSFSDAAYVDPDGCAYRGCGSYVYLITDKDGAVKYVGRSVEPGSRLPSHERRPMKTTDPATGRKVATAEMIYEPEAGDRQVVLDTAQLSDVEAAGLEQFTIEYYGLDELGNSRYEVANPSSSSRWTYEQTRAAAERVLSENPGVNDQLIAGKVDEVSIDSYHKPATELPEGEANWLDEVSGEAFLYEEGGWAGGFGLGGGFGDEE